MLTSAEQIAFVGLVVLCGALAFQGFRRMVVIVRRGRAAERGDNLVGRFVNAMIDIGLQRPMFKTRPWVSFFHALVFFGFSFFLLVNANDLLEAYVDGWTTLGQGGLFGLFNLLSDLLSVGVLVGMVALLVRRLFFLLISTQLRRVFGDKLPV